MARIRTVKPELFRHEGLYELEQETGLPIRFAFAGLFTVCDRRGRFQWRPRQLKLDVLPYDEFDFSRVLDALMTRGFVVMYENSGELYGCIPTFERHQVINNRESESELPSIDDELSEVFDSEGCPTREPRVNHATVTPLKHAQAEGKGREGEYIALSQTREEQISPLADNSGIEFDDSEPQPADNSCTGEQLQFDTQFLKMARTTGITSDYSDSDVQNVFDLFRCYKANANTLKPQSEWLGAWRTWCQREKVQYAKSNRKSGDNRQSATPANNTQRAMQHAQQAAERVAASRSSSR